MKLGLRGIESSWDWRLAYWALDEGLIRKRTGQLVVLDLMPNDARRHSEVGREVIDVLVSDDISRQSFSQEIRRNEELGGKSAIALLPFGPGASHDQRLICRDLQVFKQCPAESKANGFPPAFGYDKPGALARIRRTEGIERAGQGRHLRDCQMQLLRGNVKRLGQQPERAQLLAVQVQMLAKFLGELITLLPWPSRHLFGGGKLLFQGLEGLEVRSVVAAGFQRGKDLTCLR